MCAVSFKSKLFGLSLILILQEKFASSLNECSYYPSEYTYTCHQKIPYVYTTTLPQHQRATTTNLQLYQTTAEIIDLQLLLDSFPNVTKLTIASGNVTALTGIVNFNEKLKELRLQNLTIEELPADFLNNFRALELLDLNGNHLKTLEPEAAVKLNEIAQVTLADNWWNCSSELEWVLQLNSSLIKDIDGMKCHQQPYPGKPVLPIARFKKNVRDYCPPQCDCIMPDVVRDPSTFKLEPIIEVNCSDRNLNGFPPILPDQTKILMLERNNVRSLKPLINNPIYRDVQDLYLDYNLIDSIDNLEGVYWLMHFRVLSLSNNRLSQLPTYAIDNALQQNPNMPVAVRLYLGNNPWRCDCVFTPSFQELLRKYEMQVHDTEDIKCSYTEGDENSLTQILELSRSSVCRLPNEYSVRALDLLNGILASLIVLVLGKLAYDYYYFKKTGRLPWIVTKMP